MKSLAWEKEKSPSGSVYPNAREGHTLTYIPTIRCLLLFGGILNTRYNDIYLYDLDKKSWSVQPTANTSRQPSARCYHAAFYEEPYFFVYAGQGDKNRSLTDFYFLNIKSWVWKRLFILESPTARHYHTMLDMKNSDREKIVFGGISLPDNKLLNDVWIVNYSNVTFNSALSEIPGTVCTPKKTKGDIPCPRKGHVAAMAGKSMIIYGGKNDDGEDTNWIYQLYFESWTWKRFSGIGKPNSARSFCSYAVYEDSKLLLFGGIDNDSDKYLNDTYILELEDLHWSSPFIAGQVPSPRYNHASCSFKTIDGEWDVIIQGGLEQQYCTMEMYRLIETETKQKVQWEKLQEPSYLDTMTSDVAGATLLDQKNYLSELEHIIAGERSLSLELDGEIKKLEEEIKKERDDHATKTKVAKDQISSLDDEYQINYDLTKNLFAMIPIEQLIASELNKKNNLLEDVIQKTEGYLISLDKLFIAITKNKLDENDPGEKKLKLLADSFKDDIHKSRDLHKGSLQHLKQAYDQAGDLLKKTETDITIQRKSILEIDKSYEEILVQNEQEEI